MLAMGSLLFGATVYRSGGRQREPWWMLAGASVAGGMLLAGALGIGSVVQATVIDSGSGLSLRWTMSLTSAPLQTAAKLAVPAGVLILMRRHFNDPMAGLIYGSLAGLGGAFCESVWYSFVAAVPEPATLLHAQGPSAMRFMLHTLWGGIAGYGLGLVVMARPWRSAVAKGVGGVLGLQVLWDLFLGFAADGPETGWQRSVAALVMSGSVVGYGVLVVRTNKWSRSLHEPTSKQRLIGKIIKMVVFRRFR